MNLFEANRPPMKFAAPGTKCIVSGGCALMAAVVTYFLYLTLCLVPNEVLGLPVPREPAAWVHMASLFLLFVGTVLALLGIVLSITKPDTEAIRLMVTRGLLDYKNGNPLHLREGQRLPKIRCQKDGEGRYKLIITAQTVSAETIMVADSSISSSLRGTRFGRYGVTRACVSDDHTKVIFTLEDKLANHKLTVTDVEELRQKDPFTLVIQDDTSIDLTTSGSILVAGKTRSGKTTGVACLMLQALLQGRDKYGSEIVMIDPKRAELSQLPHVVTLDPDGGVRGILDAMRAFVETILKRQECLNEMSAEAGDAVHWWDAGFHVSILFIDEYIALRAILAGEKRSSKDNAYSLAAFDDLVRRIVTTGASAGCYMILSTAEASVQEGGLPALVRAAMSTKILFRPTEQEGKLMWDTERLATLPRRDYQAGEAWFSSTDGEHDGVSVVNFPRMEFPVYRELGRLLAAYYEDA